MTKLSKYLVIIPLSIISACAANSRLSYVSPASIDLSGDWVLDKNLSQTVVMVPLGRSKDKNRSPTGGGKGERPGGRNGDRKSEGQNSQRALPGKPASMIATQMKIEQGTDGMGIAYPKHPYLDVDWGTTKVRRATISSGWTSDGSLVIINDKDRQKFTEIYSLDATAKILSITFTVNSLKGERDYVRVFTRRETD